LRFKTLNHVFEFKYQYLKTRIVICIFIFMQHHTVYFNVLNIKQLRVLPIILSRIQPAIGFKN